VKRISWLIAFGLGCVALAWGLVYLHGIFIEERDEALAEVAGRRRALEQYAHKELEQRLAERLAASRSGIEAAATDPLLAASGVLYFDRGKQRLPRTTRPRREAGGAEKLFDALSSRPERLLAEAKDRDPDAPFTARLRLFIELREALDAEDKPGIEAAFRGILAHRAAYVIATTDDVPYTLAALAALERGARPQASLMRLMLRDGFGGDGAHLEGLERIILHQVERFSADDLRFFSRQIALLGEAHQVAYDDFTARLDEAIARAADPGETLVIPFDLVAPTLLYGGRWYVEPAGEDRVYGVQVAIDPVLAEITGAMRDRGLIEGPDLVVGHLEAPTAALSDLALEIESASWPRAEKAALERYRLKTALEGVIALLVFGVMGLGSVVYRRRHRFLELKSDFVSAVSHELRTPLASIRLMAETLERRTKDLPKAKDYPARIIRDVDGLSFLVENILSFNRLSRGRWTAKPELVNLGTIVEKLERDRDSWAKKPAELLASDLDGVVLTVDPDLLQLLLTNLARNACQYSERTPARIEIAAARDERHRLVFVRDNGVGIPEEERERIFDDFYRSTAGKKERGSGLGLSICRKIMEAHGGTIRVAETSDEGSTFELSFPFLAS
jgi:two-component system, OmpR family, sensor histidine kinase SenX3